MANIILQASSFKKNYTIDTLVVTANQYANAKIFTLEIKPNEDYIVDATDFTNGFIDKNIVSVTYSNTKKIVDFTNKVKVQVTLMDNINLEGSNTVIFVPVIGVAKVVNNVLTFIDETSQAEGITVFDKISGGILKDSSISKDVHSNTYTVTGGPGESGVIMQKIFIADEGYVFSTVPKWTIKSRFKKNYTITSQEFKDEDGILFQKIYEIGYSFPNDKYMEEYQDKIIFS